jgi:hypothetical protein
VIIDFLALDVLDKLARFHEVYAATTVIAEVKHFKRDGGKFPIDFRKEYIQRNMIKEVSATTEEISSLLKNLPKNSHFALHTGEKELLAVLKREHVMIFCTCDAATIRTLPFLNIAERGISAEELLKQSGLLKSGLLERHSEAYFKTNVAIGKEQKIYKL